MTDVPTYEKKILPIELPSMVKAKNFSHHPRTYYSSFSVSNFWSGGEAAVFFLHTLRFTSVYIIIFGNYYLLNDLFKQTFNNLVVVFNNRWRSTFW